MEAGGARGGEAGASGGGGGGGGGDKAKAHAAPAQAAAPAVAQAKDVFLSSRSVSNYEKLEQVGEGTYGQVYMARDNQTREIVALKKVRMDNEKEGFPITAIREIKLLKSLRHENVVRLKEIVTSKASSVNQNKGSIYMVFEYMDHDLAGLAERPGMKFTIPQIKCYMRQLLMGITYCHKNNVLHRDIKGANLLIDNRGHLKLADFGLARPFGGIQAEEAHALTNNVITLWYRPPELLLGSTKYGPEVDMWSVGCILAELLYHKPILPGRTEVEQLDRIYRLVGSPTEENWPGHTQLQNWKVMKHPEKPYESQLHTRFQRFSKDALDLVERMLVLDPSKRITAAAATDADWFWNDPLPCDPQTLPKYEASHEFQTKKRRRMQQPEEQAKAARPH